MSTAASTVTVIAAVIGVGAVQAAWVQWALGHVTSRLDRMEHRLATRFDHVDERLDRLANDVIRDHGERIARLEAREP